MVCTQNVPKQIRYIDQVVLLLPGSFVEYVGYNEYVHLRHRKPGDQLTRTDYVSAVLGIFVLFVGILWILPRKTYAGPVSNILLP